MFPIARKKELGNNWTEANVTDKIVRSFSQLTSYYQCPHAYYLKRIEKVRERPSVYLLGGSAFHAATEAFDVKWFQLENEKGLRLGKAEENDLALERQYYGNLFEIEFDESVDKAREDDPDETTWRVAGVGKLKSRPEGDDLAWWRVAGREMTEKYVDWRAKTDDTLTTAAVESCAGVEVEVRTQIGHGLEVVAYVDRVRVDRNTGVLLVEDEKTGTRKPKDAHQLGQYSVMLEEAGTPVTWGAYYMARKGELLEAQDLSGFTAEKMRENYLRLEDNIQAERFPPVVSPLCKSCGLNYACEFYNDPKGE